MARKPIDEAAVEASRVTGSAFAATPEVADTGPQTRHVTSTPLFFEAPAYVAPDRAPAVTHEQDADNDQAATRWAGYSNLDYWKDFVSNETILGSSLILLRENGIAPDQNYVPDVKSPEFKSIVEGIDPEQWHLVAAASSAEQARAIAFRLNDEKERAARLMEGGLLPFIASNVINPESLALAVASGGLAWAQKGTRLARVAKQAGLAAGENMAIEAALNVTQDNRDPMDVAIAGAAGVILGGAFGAFSKALPADAGPHYGRAAQADFDKLVEVQAADMGIVQPKPYSLKRAEVEADAKLLDAELDEVIEAEVSRLREIVEGPEGRAVAMRNDAADTVARLQRNVEGRDADAAELAANVDARNRTPDVPEEPAMSTRRGTLSKRVDDANKLISALKLDVDRVNRVRSAEGDLAMILNGRKAAKDAPAKADILPAGRKREGFQRRIAAQQAAFKEAADEEAADAAMSIAPPAPAGGAPGFGADSASAARLDVGVESAAFPDPITDTAATARPGIFGIKLPRFDYASILRSPSLPDSIREVVGKYVGDSVPEKGKVSMIGASEKAAQLRDRYLTRFSQVYESSFNEWAMQGGKFNGSRRVRREFGRGVTKAIRVEGDHPPHFKAAASRMRELFAEIGQEAKDAGVKGFEEFTADSRYFPRVPDRPKIMKSRDAYTGAAITDAVDKSIVKGYADIGIPIDAKVATRIAEGYYKRLLDLAQGIEQEALSGLRLTDADQIAGLMRLAGSSEEVITETTGRLRLALTEGGTEGSPRYAKARTLLDEDMEHNVFNVETGKTDTVSLRDMLFHDDAQQVFDTYNHTMSGWTALARYAGVRSRGDHQKIKDAVLRDMTGKEGVRAAEAVDDAFKFIIGQPLYDTKRWTSTRRLGRALRDYQFARVMNMVGFAQVPDAASFLTPKYIRHTARHFPEMFGIFNRMKDGSLEHKVARDCEEFLGGATDGLQNKLFSAYDDEPDAPVSKAEHALRYAGRYTEGSIGGKLRNWFGVTPMTQFNQRLGELAVTSRFADNLTGKLKDMADEDWMRLGVSGDDLVRLKAEAAAKISFDSGKLRDLDLASWEPEVREKFVMAAHRETRRLQQEEDFSDTNPLMHSSLGKIALQFRRFGLVSYTKQLVRGVADRDAETLARLAVQVHMGGLAYTAQMYLYSLSKPAEEAQEFREKYINWRTFYMGGIARAGMFSLTPALIESLYQLATGDESTFNKTRTTGLAGNLVAGIPVVDFANNLARSIGGISEAIVRGDRQYDKKDFAALRKSMLFSNMIVVKQLMDVIQNTLPDGDDDTDAESVQWNFLSSP